MENIKFRTDAFTKLLMPSVNYTRDESLGHQQKQVAVHRQIGCVNTHFIRSEANKAIETRVVMR
jgi:hypothetical protein